MDNKERKEPMFKLDGKNCFLEVVEDGFGIEKVQINFCTYDKSREPGKRQTAFIPFYISFEEFIVFADNVRIGRFKQKTDKAQAAATAAQKQWADPVFHMMGGTTKEALNRSGRARADGMSISRQLRIYPGSKQAYLVVCEQGAGEQNEKGLIVPRYGTKPDQKVMVPVSEDAMHQLAARVSLEIQAYITAKRTTEMFVAMRSNNKSAS